MKLGLATPTAGEEWSVVIKRVAMDEIAAPDSKNTLYKPHALFYRETRWASTWRISEFLGQLL